MRYVQAVKLWNAEEHTVSTPDEVYATPRKGTEAYNEVRSIMKKPVADTVKVADLSKIEAPAPTPVNAPVKVTRKIMLKKSPTPPVEIKEESKPKSIKIKLKKDVAPEPVPAPAPPTDELVNELNGLMAENADEGEFEIVINFNDEFKDFKDYKYSAINYIQDKWIPGFEKNNTISKLRKGLVIRNARGTGEAIDKTSNKAPGIKAKLYKLDDDYNEILIVFTPTAENSTNKSYKEYSPRALVELKPNNRTKKPSLDTFNPSK